MFIVEIPNRNSPPAILLREGWREGSKVHTRTLANLSHLAPEKIEALKAALKGGSVTNAVPIPESSLPHGHVLAVTGMMDKLGLPKLLFGKRHHLRELALALVAGRVIEPGSKLSLAQALAKGAEHHSLGEVLGLGELGKAIDPENSESSQEKRAAGEFYAAMDWLLERQAKVEDALAKRHLSSGCTVLYDLSSSYFEGSTCPLKAHLFICMLAYYIEWHLREAWAPLLYTDEEGTRRDTPVSPVQASESGKLKKQRAHGVDGLPLQSFTGLMKSLATLCQNRIHLGEKGPLYTRATRPTPLQAKAFGLIGVAIA